MVSMNGRIVLLCVFVFFFALADAVNFSVNQTISLNDNRPTSVFVDEGYIYLTFSGSNHVQRYNLTDGRLRLDRRYGSDDTESSNFIGVPIDVWVDGDYLYVVNEENVIFKIEKGTSDIKFKGESDSYKPDSAAAVAAKGDRIYLVDTENDRVNILLEAHEHDYLSNGSISYTFLGTADALLNSPRDIAIYGDEIYVADSDNDRIAVFYTNLTYAGCYGKGIGQAYLSSPVYIALDGDYLYVVGWGRRTIDVILRENRKRVASINSTIYAFKSIAGIYAYDSKLYVVDENNKSMVILNVDKTTLQGYDEVAPLYSEMKGDVDYVCGLYSVATALNANMSDKCPQYRERLDDVEHLMATGKYDDAYAVMVEDMRPKVDGDKAYLKTYIENELYSRHSGLEDRLEHSATTMPSGLYATYSSINLALQYAKDMINTGNYSGALAQLKEIEVRIGMLEMAAQSETETHGMLNESYSEELASMHKSYADIKEKLKFYNITFDDGLFRSLMENASNALNAYDMETAYAAIHEAEGMLSDAESAVSERETEVLYANETLVAAQHRLSELKNSSFFIISPNTAPIEMFISNATAILYSNPLSAKEYAEQALEAVEKEEKDFEDAKFMLLFGIALMVFLLIFSGLVGAGLRFLLKRKRQ